MLGAQAADFAVGHAGYHGRAAGAVGTDDDAAHLFVFIGGFQTLAQFAGLVFAGGNRAFEADYGSVRLGGDGIEAAHLAENGKQIECQKGDEQQAENELPNTGAALLAVGFEQEFFQRVALPVAAVGLAIAADDVFHGVTFFA